MINILESGHSRVFAVANKGHLVTVVEIIPSAIEKIQQQALKQVTGNSLKIILGDFYEISGMTMGSDIHRISTD